MKKIMISLLLSIILTATSQAIAFAEAVMMNTETHKVHKISCMFAKKCTQNCVKVERKDAYNKGGVPCKKCGG